MKNPITTIDTVFAASKDPDALGVIIPLTPHLLAECADKGMLVIPVRKGELKIDIVFIYGQDNAAVTRIIARESENLQEVSFPESANKTVQ